MKYVFFLVTICWSLICLIGSLWSDWDVGQMVFFINIGFLSLGYSYYAGLVLITFADFRRGLFKRSEDDLFSSMSVIVFLKSLGYLLTIVMLTLGLFMVTILTGTFAAAYFYIVYKIKSLEELAEKWDENWNYLLVLGGVILCVEVAIFLRQMIFFNQGKRIGWDSFSPFTRNSKYKINVYLYGSIFVVALDGFLNDFNTFGYLSLGWLFLMNIIWALIDMFYPPSLPDPVEEIDANN